MNSLAYTLSSLSLSQVTAVVCKFTLLRGPTMLRSAGRKADCTLGGIRRWAHAFAQPAPLGTVINHPINTTLPPFVLPENHDDNKMGADFPNLPYSGGAMELMAVPKKKVKSGFISFPLYLSSSFAEDFTFGIHLKILAPSHFTVL